MLSFTEKYFLKCALMVNDENYELAIVQNIKKDTALFLFKDKLKMVIKQPKVANISQISTNYFSYQIDDLEFKSDLKALEAILKLKNDPIQDLFCSSKEWADQYLILETNAISPNHPVHHTKYICQIIHAEIDNIATFDHLTTWVGSWNVNSQSNIPKSLDGWILDQDYDICVFGFQELDTSTEAYIVQDSKRELEWSLAIQKSLEKKEKYIKIASKQLVGMLIMIYVKACHEEYISQIATASIGTGILGVMGNKGAVAIRFSYKQSTFCFVNSHLAADSSMVEKRNQDYKDISTRMDFPINSLKNFEEYCIKFPWIPVDWSTITLEILERSSLSIFDADHLIWLGDLNYRVCIPEEQAKQLISSNQIDELLSKDQLTQEREALKAFANFKEGKISFNPTYKYEVGTDNYYDGEKSRTPSWCDRILWYQNPLHVTDESWSQLLWYKTVMELRVSDHKPVMACFKLKTRAVDSVKYEKTVDGISRQLDALENASLPTVKISQQQLDFGDVRFQEPKTCSFIIENIGTTLAQFTFAPKPGHVNATTSWCHLSHKTGKLDHGEKMQVFVTILVDKPELSRALTYGKAQLNDILLIRISNSSDFFISIESNWLPTIFGIDITYLCLLNAGLRTLTPLQLAEKAENLISHSCKFSKLFLPNGKTSDEELCDSASIRFSIPRQIRILLDFLSRMRNHHQLESNIHHGVYQYLCECLNYGIEINLELFLPVEPFQNKLDIDCITPLNHQIPEIIEFERIVKSWNIKSSMALSCGIQVLFTFLESIPEPIIPYSMYHDVISLGSQSLSGAKSILYKLPTTHYNLFIYICSFFRQWLKNDTRGVLKTNMSNLTTLTLVHKLSNLLIREPLNSQYITSENSTTRSKKLEFVSHFILKINH